MRTRDKQDKQTLFIWKRFVVITQLVYKLFFLPCRSLDNSVDSKENMHYTQGSDCVHEITPLFIMRQRSSVFQAPSADEDEASKPPGKK